MDVSKTIARNIRYYRELCFLTQQELADALLVSRTTIQKWEAGRNRMYPEDLYRISKIFDVKVEELFIRRPEVLL